jgi:hypothetical protein
MKKILITGWIICLTSIFALAQTQSFEVFDKAVKDQQGGFNGNKENLSRIFNEERHRLHDSFEPELLKYLDRDVEKHYWIGYFLSWKGYLHGSPPLPELVFRIRRKGFELLAGQEDNESLGRKITFLRHLAIDSYLLGKKDLAIQYKKQVNPILKKNDEIGAYVGAMTEFEYCIYDNLEKNPANCREETEKPKEKIILAGFINSKALYLPKPKYPKESRKKEALGPGSGKGITWF